MKKTPSPSRYTCNEYREEMILLGLVRKLADDSLSPQEKEKIRQEIETLEKRMGIT